MYYLHVKYFKYCVVASFSLFFILEIIIATPARAISTIDASGILSPVPTTVPVSRLTASRQMELENQLKDINSQIDAQQKILETKQRESVSLERDVAILDAKISEAELSIKARNLNIERLSAEINSKVKTIGTLSSKLDREKESLSQILRKTREADSFSISKFVLDDKKMSDIFSDSESFSVLKNKLNDSLDTVTEVKGQTEEEKAALDDKKSEQVDMMRIQQLEKAKIVQQENDKKSILKASKGLEAEYQKILAAKKKNAAQIRAELFSLTGTKAISFENALDYANFASQKTGVRSAFILGIVAEESNLGQNIGTGNWKVDMHPTRDVPIFAQICASLGLDPDKMPVSKKAWYGWGGAMGPAQFIPSTWVLYTDRIASLTGNNPPSPWNPKDAFMASAILSKDNGANDGGRSAERLAALRYLAGRKNATKPAYAFYGNDVMDLADKYQSQIDILNGQ